MALVFDGKTVGKVQAGSKSEWQEWLSGQWVSEVFIVGGRAVSRFNIRQQAKTVGQSLGSRVGVIMALSMGSRSLTRQIVRLVSSVLVAAAALALVFDGKTVGMVQGSKLECQNWLSDQWVSEVVIVGGRAVSRFNIRQQAKTVG